MKQIKKMTFILGILSIIPINLYAINCTEADIRNSLTQKTSFSYKAKGCTNANGIITITSGIPVTLNKWIFDGGGVAHLLWKGAGTCDRFPRTSPFSFFYINASGVLLTNFMADGAPEGIHVESGNGNVIDKVIFPIVCEKAIRQGNESSTAATNTIVRNSKFYTGAGNADHTILVHGGSITVQGNYFKDPRGAVSACGIKGNPGYHPAGLPCNFPAYITTISNVVDGCIDYGMQSSGPAKGGYLRSAYNTFSRCKTPLRVDEQGSITASSNTFKGPCDQALLSTSSTASGLYACGNKNACTNTISGPGLKAQSVCK